MINCSACFCTTTKGEATKITSTKRCKSNSSSGRFSFSCVCFFGGVYFSGRRLKPLGEGKPGQWRRYEFSFKPSKDAIRDASSDRTDEVHERYVRGGGQLVCHILSDSAVGM